MQTFVEVYNENKPESYKQFQDFYVREEIRQINHANEYAEGDSPVNHVFLFDYKQKRDFTRENQENGNIQVFQ